MRQLKEAREILLDDQRRREYDQRLAAAPPSGMDLATAAPAGDWLELARQALATGDHRTASRAAQEAAPNANQRPAEIWGIMAQANAALGRYDDAIFEAQRAIQLEPQNIDHRYALASAFEQAGDWSRALAAYDDLARLDPGSELPRLGSASVYMSSGDPARAAQLLEPLYAERASALAGDYLAMALLRMAELVPAARDGEGYAITSEREIDMMRRMLARAQDVTRDPGLQSDIAAARGYVEHMAGREFVWQRLFGRWGRRLAGLGLLGLCCTGVLGQASGEYVLFALVMLGVLGGGAGLVAYALVPRWKFNRAEQTGRYLTY
jgi:tetratricopeptide (TPR) repeat protein